MSKTSLFIIESVIILFIIESVIICCIYELFGEHKTFILLTFVTVAYLATLIALYIKKKNTKPQGDTDDDSDI